VVLGNGGASAFWDIACASLITRKAAFGTYGSFSSKFAKSAQSAPFLEEPEIFAGEPGTYRLPELTEYVDTYCWAHNETSTGVAAPIKRIAGTKEQGALTLIDATSGAGALPVDISQTDAYYFSPQKAFGSDGGLWIAVLSPAAIERAYGIAKSVDLPGARRWIPPFLSLTSAIENSRKDQTLNTPAVATLIMLENQVRWLNDNGGLAWASARCARSASLLYQWAEKSDYASPFVNDRNARSNAVVTIDINDGINASQVVAALRENGIVDTNGYRKLGRNQLRIGVFPSVEPSDVDALTRCIDYVVEHLRCGDMKIAPIIDPSVRKPSPKPVRVDLRKVFMFGTALWAIALVVCIVLITFGIDAERAQTVCEAGTVIGVLMLVWEHFDRWDYRRLGE